jgi:hypothetical protein
VAKARPELKRAVKNRLTGINRAAERLAKEETEIDEASKKPNATTRHLRQYPVSDKDVAKPVKQSEYQHHVVSKLDGNVLASYKSREDAHKNAHGNPVVSGSLETIGDRKYVREQSESKPVTYYSLVHKATNKVLSTHKDLESAKDEHRGMDQGERAHYRIATTTKAPKSFSMKEDAEGVAEDISSTKKKISKYEELALAANRAGDDAKSKQYQQKIQVLKQKMSQGVAEENILEGAYEKSEENKRSADAAKKQGDMFAHHLHMADHHDNLAQWHAERGRHSVADSHAAKAEEHQEKAMEHKKQGVAEAAFKDPSPMMKDSIKQDRIRSLKNLIAVAKVKGVHHKVKEYELELKKLKETTEVTEAGAFSYGAKPPRKGSVAYNALMKRKEQDKNRVKEIEAIGTKNHHVGVAKVTKAVAEGYTGRETKDGTWRVFKDGQAVAVAGPFKSRDEAHAWIKKHKQGVSEAKDTEMYKYIDQSGGHQIKGKSGTYVGYTHSATKGKGANILKHNTTKKYYAAGGSSTAFTAKTTLHDTPQAAARAYHKGNLAEQDEKEAQEYDYEGDMARSDLRSIIFNAQEVHDMLEPNTNLPEWVQAKITKAEDYMSSVRSYMKAENEDL